MVPRPQITITSQGSFNIFNSIRRTLDLSIIGFTFHGGAKSESENLKGKNKFKMPSAKIILKLKRLGAKVL